MNNISSLQNIGGNLFTKKYYKFNEDAICDLSNNDYNLVITNANTINLTVPLKINGIISHHI